MSQFQSAAFKPSEWAATLPVLLNLHQYMSLVQRMEYVYVIGGFRENETIKDDRKEGRKEKRK